MIRQKLQLGYKKIDEVLEIFVCLALLCYFDRHAIKQLAHTFLQIDYSIIIVQNRIFSTTNNLRCVRENSVTLLASSKWDFGVSAIYVLHTSIVISILQDSMSKDRVFLADSLSSLLVGSFLESGWTHTFIERRSINLIFLPTQPLIYLL